MGQKVNPNGFRYGITKKHESKWYSDKNNFSKYLLQDDKIRKYLLKFDRKYKIGNIVIERKNNDDIIIYIHTAKPGELLGQGGENLKLFTNNLKKHLKNRKLKINIQIVSIEKPELNAALVAEEIAIKLENRGSFRAAQKFAIRSALRAGASGIKTQVSGRLNGADMARTEGYTEGIMSLHTLRQNVDFAMATARTTYGAIGIKIWISKGQILNKKRKSE